MKRLVAALVLLAAPAFAQAQRPATLTIGAGAPSGACSMGRFYIRTSNSALYYCNASGAWAAMAVGGDLSAYATTAGVADGTYNLVGTRVTSGLTSTHDRLVLLPTTKGAAQADGNITSADLTDTRVWTFPDLDGTVALLGVANGSTFSAGSLIAGDTATHDRILVTPVVKGAGQADGTISSRDLTGARTWYFPNAGGEVAILGTTQTLANLTSAIITKTGTAPNETSTTFGQSTDYVQLTGYGNTAGTINSVVSVSGSNQLISLTATNPTTAASIVIEPTGVTYGMPKPKALYTLIGGGFTLGASTTSAGFTVKVTVVDTTPSITDGDVQVCGYTSSGNQTALLKTCETLDFAAGAGNHTTTATFVEVTNIKASSFATLGGGGDETIAAEWTSDPAEPIFTAVNLTNSAATNLATSPIPVAESYWSPLCLDLQGCAVEPDVLGVGGVGKVLYIVGRDGTNTITFADSANLDMAASGPFDMGAGDTLVLLSTGNSKSWVELSRSNN